MKRQGKLKNDIRYNKNIFIYLFLFIHLDLYVFVYLG